MVLVEAACATCVTHRKDCLRAEVDVRGMGSVQMQRLFRGRRGRLQEEVLMQGEK